MDIDIIAGLVSFAALIMVWAVAPSKPAREANRVSVVAPAATEAVA